MILMSTDTESLSYSPINLNGFDRESTSMIRELEAEGWTFRRSTHGVVGHAPDGETTISISQRAGAKARRHVRADISRWRRKQNVILAVTAWKTSQRVLERTWPDGTADYLCVYEDCGFTSDNPRAVAQHYGATHTRRGESPLPPAALSMMQAPATAGPRRPPAPDVVVSAVGQMAHDISQKTVEIQHAAAAAATQVAAVLTAPTPAATEPEPSVSEPEPEPEVEVEVEVEVEEAGAVPPVMEQHVLHALTPDQERRLKILDQVVKLVSAPIQADVDRLTRELEVARAERDAFRARLEQVTSDLDGLRSLIDGIVGSR